LLFAQVIPAPIFVATQFPATDDLARIDSVAVAPAAPSDISAKTYTLGGAAPEALFVALHYSSGTLAMWDALVADWGTAIRVVLPQGPIPHYRTGHTWFAPAHEQKDAADQLADVEAMASRVARLIRETRIAHPEIRRVAVTGFSYGGDIAWLLAMRYPELVDFAVPMGSRLLGNPNGPTAMVRILHGEADKIINVSRVSARVATLARQGVPIKLTVYPALGHDMSPELIADWRAALRAALATGGVRCATAGFPAVPC
jgi:phospholipase/carboxylesterase